MSNTKTTFSKEEVRAHWRNVLIVLFLLASPFLLYISYIIWVEIAIPRFSPPKEFVKVFHIPGGNIPAKDDEFYYDIFTPGGGRYYTELYVSELGYDAALALMEQRSSTCEMRTSAPSWKPFFVAIPVMVCNQSALPNASIDIEIQSLQEHSLDHLHLNWLREKEHPRFFELLEEQRGKYRTVLFVTVVWFPVVDF